jgi:hypothetical protein
MEKAKDHFLEISLPHVFDKKVPQQYNNRIIPYWHFASDRFALLV